MENSLSLLSDDKVIEKIGVDIESDNVALVSGEGVLD